ncbi:MAG TPA: phytanoyl-CoA dioxygenase family protein [Planctomycetaceae bacterium]|nr:phytanoyl-CoA dioxygenase family protein [Planctomycetaceae bacterium]
MALTADRDSALTARQLEQYRADGFLVLRNVFSTAEIEAAALEADRLRYDRRDLIDTNNLRCRFQKDVHTGECLFETFDPIADVSCECHRIAHDRRILDPLALIYGEPACLFKDKLIYKPPGAVGYGLHQDFIAWPGFPRSFLTVLVAIDACDPENGSTELFPGYHHNGTLSPEDGQYHELPLELVDLSKGHALTLAPGDIAIFGGFTPHRSAPNRSDRWRRQLYLSYNALSDGGEQHDKHYAEFHAWLRKRYTEHGKNDVYFR